MITRLTIFDGFRSHRDQLLVAQQQPPRPNLTPPVCGLRNESHAQDLPLESFGTTIIHRPAACPTSFHEANQAFAPAARETTTDCCRGKRCKTPSAKRNKFLIFVVPPSEPPQHPHEPSSPQTTDFISNIPHTPPIRSGSEITHARMNPG